MSNTSTHTAPKPVPGGRTARLRNIRVPDELWDAARAKAAANDDDLSKVLRRMLREYVDQD